MAEEQAQVTQPAAAPPPTAARALPFADQMKAIDPKVFDPDTPTHPDTPALDATEPTDAAAADAAPEPAAKGKPKPKVIEVPTDATKSELDQLKALATKLGLTFEDGKVTTGERARLRDEHRRQRAMLEQQEREATERVTKATNEFAERLKYAEEVGEFKSTRDFQKLAKSLGFETWDKLQEEVIAQNTDPNYRRLRELEDYRAQQERREQERQEAEQRRQQESARVEAQQRYMTKLSADMSQSKDPLVQAMADDPSFAAAIFQIQREHYNPADDSTVTPEQAAAMSVRGANKPVRSELEALYQRLHKVFGKAAPAPVPAAGTVAKPKPHTDAIPAPRASKVVKHDPTKRAWFEMAEAQMRQAADEDHRRELANRGARG